MLFLLSVVIDHLATLRDHLSYIEQKCRQMVSRKQSHTYSYHRGESVVDAALENEADELYLTVLEHLRKDDCKVLRTRKGDSSLPTYLAVVIGNLYTDSIRRMRGRDMRRERASQFGLTGEAVYRHCIKGDYTLEAAGELLASHHGVSATIPELSAIRDRIENCMRTDPDIIGKLAMIHDREDTNDAPLFEIRTDENPEMLLGEAQRESLARQLLDEFGERLNGTEKLIISLKFPAEDTEGRSFKEIAALLKMTPKTVEHAYYGCLARFRESLIARGVNYNAVVNCEA